MLRWTEQASGGILQHCLGYESDPDSSPSCGFPVTRTSLSPLILALLCALKEKEPELGSVAYSATGLQQDIQRPKEQTCLCFLFLQTQVAVWGLRCRQPLASCPPESQAGRDPGVVSSGVPPGEGPVLLPGYGCLGKDLQNVFQVELN